jgi:hypothetical protein
VPVVRLAVAACVLLVLAACGAGRATDEARQSLGTPTASSAAQKPERADYLARDGVTRSLGNGITLSVSAPTSFTPTEEAYPKAARAVAFELVIHNQGDAAFRPAQLLFVATVDGAATDQVIDSTQGYSGVADTADEVLPSQTFRFAVAFGISATPCVVRVTVRSTSTSTSTATSTISIFDGTV